MENTTQTSEEEYKDAWENHIYTLDSLKWNLKEKEIEHLDYLQRELIKLVEKARDNLHKIRQTELIKQSMEQK